MLRANLYSTTLYQLSAAREFMRDQIKNPLLGSLLSGHNDKMAEKKALHKFIAFLDFFLSLYTWSFSLMFIFRRWKKINLWNTAHFLCQTNNPLCAGVDSITQLLSCVPRLKKLHLKMLWWCSVSERILSVQDTASLLNIFLAVCEEVNGISQHLI